MMFITFEGIDFSGKSTQCRRLADFLAARGHDVVLLREPGGTALSEKIRQLLLDKNSDGLEPLAEFFLYSAARAQLVEEIIRPALQEGKIVICDRFFDSSIAYQGGGRGINIAEIEAVNRISTGELTPDLTIIIDISIETSLNRLKLAGKSTDRIESEGVEFFARIRDTYLQLATGEKTRFKVVNGDDDIDTIERRVRDIVIDHFRI